MNTVLQGRPVRAQLSENQNYSWKIDGHKTKQVTCFKYLGVVLYSANCRNPHGVCITENAQRSSYAIFKFLKTRVPTIFLRLFQAKPIAQLLNAAHLGSFSNFSPLELLQSKFLSSSSPQMDL